MLKNKNQGFRFSWIHLFVFVILGILAAWSLSAWSSGTQRAKQAEARNNIGAMNRAQQNYFLDHQKFTTDLAKLRVLSQSKYRVEIKTETTNYSYRIELSSQFRQFRNFQGKSLPYGDYVVHIAQAKKPHLNSYIGFVYTEIGNLEPFELLTVAGACESKKNTTLPPPLTLGEYSDYLVCPEGYQNVVRCKGVPN